MKLDEFANGGLSEKFNVALEKVLENMVDPNTPWKNKRKIQVEVTFIQNEDRDDSTINIQVTTKLAPVKPVETKMAIGKDLKTGKVYGEEYGKQIRGQITIEDYAEGLKIFNGDVVNTETGEVTGKVVGMKQKEA